MNRPLQIGVTGGIGSGKSVVCKIFRQFGVSVYDADSHAKDLMTTDGILINGIKKEFGDLAYQNGALNRVYLGDHVFNDPVKLKILNGLVHPRVKVDYENWVKAHAGERYVVKEAALLFEAGSDKALDAIIVVHAPENLRIERVLKRDPHRSVEQLRGIVEKQMAEDEKLKRADFVIVNDGTQLILPQVLALHEKFSRVESM